MHAELPEAIIFNSWQYAKSDFTYLFVISAYDYPDKRNVNTLRHRVRLNSQRTARRLSQQSDYMLIGCVHLNACNAEVEEVPRKF